MAQTRQREIVDEAQEDLYAALQEKMRRAKTPQELRETIDEDFKSKVATLPESRKEELRDFYLVCLNQVKGKVKLEDIKDVPLLVLSIDFPRITENTPTNARTGEPSQSVVVRGKREDNKESFEFITGGVRIYRHFARDSQTPQRVTIYQESEEEMQQRNAKPGTNPMWLIRRHAPASNAANSPIRPF